MRKQNLPARVVAIAWTGLVMLPVILAMLACASALPKPGVRDATTAQRRWPGATLGELETGRSLYVTRCANCHTLKDPASVRADAWPAKISKMQKEHNVQLASSEARLIERYLYAMSSRTN